ncbi:glycosyltransferase [bacterium]|nr:glycosyltransferase [bacterium]
MNILGILPHSIGGRLTISSVFDGFIQNGHFVQIYDELKQDNFLEFINGKNYDYIVGYDFSPVKLKVDNNLHIPLISYFSDVIEGKASGVNDDWQKYLPYLECNDNYTFYWDRELCKKINNKNIFYLPHFVNTEIYKPLNLKKEFDIMFAGRLDTDYRLNFFIELMQNFPNLSFGWFAIQRHFEDALSRTDEKELLKHAYMGFIDNEKSMAQAINKAKIVINMNSQGISSLNYRTIQTVACKTLLISDFREELDLFSGNLPFYVNSADLVEKINYYLNNQKAYCYVADKCYEVVSQRLNSKICVNLMLQKLG